MPRVHPRVCGETFAAVRGAALTAGPSPRVRGNLLILDGDAQPDGSIPACAGKPCLSGAVSGCGRVHPRVCGETCGRRGRPRRSAGPSPRVRGNQRRAGHPCSCRGSIPACAGKPWREAHRARIARVHPRVCGETERGQLEQAMARGPSPRVRGNRWRGGMPTAVHGSIPACAGKPRRPARTRRSSPVHPRVCGETLASQTASQPLQGPSPRVRGNRIDVESGPPLFGSIPACAGKPTALSQCDMSNRVHPRVCGETRAGKEGT